MTAVPRIEAPKSTQGNGARTVVADAVRVRLSELAVETLIGPLAKKLGVNLTSARKSWKEIEGEIKPEEAAFEKRKREALSGEEREAAARAAARDCALRWKRQSRRVRIARLPLGLDFNYLPVGRASGVEGGPP